MSVKNLTDWFSQVYLLNCAHRPDRMERVRTELTESGMVDWEKVTVYSAVVGDYVTAPADWHSGNGAWGCLRSYQRMLEDMLHNVDDRNQLCWESVLFLEDDVYFLPDALENLNKFMPLVPEDWGQIYLGGQHTRTREKLSENLYRGASVNRTHAFAVNSSIAKHLYRHISYASDYMGTLKHVDHQLELAHRRKTWPVYCPEKWICGQRGGPSNISGKTPPDQTWI